MPSISNESRRFSGPPHTLTPPTPAEAAPLRVLYDGNPVIRHVVALLAPFVGDQDRVVHGPDGKPLTRVEAAALLLPMWRRYAELTPREAFAVMAFFVEPVAGEDVAR